MGLYPHSGCVKNVGHRVARSTVAAILKEQGIPPSGARSTSWQTLLRAHWRVIVGADFFTTEVLTERNDPLQALFFTERPRRKWRADTVGTVIGQYASRVRRRPRLGGLLNFHGRAA